MRSFESGRRLAGWLGLAALSTVGYLLLLLPVTALGFPLDDAWIHQVFARNLAQRGEFSYNPGQLVAGSTSPLWTGLLVPGYAFDGFYLTWTYGLGILFLALVAREGFELAHLLTGNSKVGWGVALFLLFEWRLTWAATSGMEILLFTFGCLFLSRYYLTHFSSKSPVPEWGEITCPRTGENHLSPDGGKSPAPEGVKILLGLFGGLLMLVRPEGMVLLGLAGLDLGWQWRGQWRRLAVGWGLILTGWLVAALPYFAFNYALSGSPLPNTFGAKVNFYAELSIEGLLNYTTSALFQLFLAGPLFVLVPGLLWCGSLVWQGKLDGRLLVWPLVLFGLYAVRLPVIYHHARYLMPLIPFLVLYGAIGTVGLMNWLRGKKLPVLARSLPWILGLAVVLTWYNGLTAYQFDVKYINDEQVRVGRWLAQNTPPEVIVATHDIGAITYFGRRKLVDTAGLVSPEFVPIVRDEGAILAKVQERRADYFVLLPGWYPRLYLKLEEIWPKVFQPQETYLAQFGEENMAVFKLR